MVIPARFMVWVTFLLIPARSRVLARFRCLLMVFVDESGVGDVTEGDLPEDEDEDATVKEVHDSMKSPRPTLYEHSETPGGSVYWVPHEDERITVPEEGKSYDTIDEAIEMYSNYAEAGGFQIKKAGQKTTKSRIVTLKYLMCNKEGAPRHVNIDTLDAKHSGKQKRQTTIHVTCLKPLHVYACCKARIRLELDIVTRRYKLVKFVPEYNHMLLPKEYKHFTKK
ncbi:FAR1 DNA binding domain-containing protein [Artemisia annua]|uniref:FAR1 DNA binding domain-containing protein n=1 Tax=Artemisia annua TaxID=35608 RepID=A0A2U1LHZ7_ARTAN|nr:FAR1 DNA binding domain-containing protein [Artemisia annua]